VSFGRDGKVLTDLGGGGDEAWAVALQQDGKIIVAGDKGISGGVLVRYAKSGKLDPSFGRAGKVLTKSGARPLDSACRPSPQIAAALGMSRRCASRPRARW
jgi:beta-propeller uncharacterized protein DUF5122